MNDNSNLNSPAVEDDGLFYFESDHLALKGNRDYSEMLKTLFLLEVQQSQAIKDYEKLMEMHTQALSKPNTFFKRVMAGLDLNIPDLQVIVELPNIDWSKYPVEFPSEVQQFLNNETFQKPVNNEPVKQPSPEKKSTHKNKQTWSTDEQRRLEELLVIYPPESIELRRYKKIAAALGNRTVQQVSSRVQKYFLKLYKAGLPIPGRIPKNAEKSKKSKLHAHQRFNHLLLKPTTFFPQLDIPVVMNEAEAIPGPSTDTTSFTNTEFHNYLLPTSSQHGMSSTVVEETKNDIDFQIQLLKRVKLEKEKCNYPIQHVGYKCNYCAEDPIYGTRWHCEVCTEDSVDFCTDCVVGQLYSVEPHPLSHHLQPYSEQRKLETNSSSESASKGGHTESNKNDRSNSDNGSDSNNSDSDSSSTPSENGSEAMNVDEGCNIRNDIDNFQDTIQEDGLLDHQLNFPFNIEHDNVLDMVDTSTYDKSWFHREEDQASLISDSSLFTDAQNLSYSYLHSNLKLADD